MASTAISGQNSKLRVASASGTAITITAISKANPCVVTATNTLAAGDIVTISGVVGMIEINGRAFVVQTATGTNFTLKGLDSTNYTTYVSGGTANKQTMIDVGNVTGFSGFDGTASEVDVTNLASTAKEYRTGLQDFGSCSLDIQVDSSDAGQSAVTKAKGTGAPTAFSLVLSNAATTPFIALVKSYTVDVKPDGVVGGKVSLRITGEPGAWFA